MTTPVLPKDIEQRFDEQFMDGNTNKPHLLLRDGNAHLMRLIKQFIAQALHAERERIEKEHQELHAYCWSGLVLLRDVLVYGKGVKNPTVRGKLLQEIIDSLTPPKEEQ